MSSENSDFLEKVPSGIYGLDEITGGGYPKGRPVLICGGAGCGKTLFGIQFLVNGILTYGEPGVLMSFEEPSEDLAKNVRSLGFDLEKLQKDDMLRIDFVKVERSEIEETGEYDLEALFIRLNYALESIGAKRVVLDTLESLFAGVEDRALLRSEIRRLFMWLKEREITAIITGERGVETFTRHGLEEYISDCVILLDFRVIDQIATRRLRIIKYRGSAHGTNEYPFLIDEQGISVMPITSLKLDYEANTDIISLGLPGLDALFPPGGIYKGSSILITGSAGTSKTQLGAYFAAKSCERGEKVLFFSFEESQEQLLRNLGSIGLDLEKYIKDNCLRIHASRPSLEGLEKHLLNLFRLLDSWKPQTVIIDPISSLTTIGNRSEVRAMLIRLLDVFKSKGINALFTSLTNAPGDGPDETVDAVSSLADIWLEVCNVKAKRGRSRKLTIIKTRGMGHYNNPVEFWISNKGIEFEEINADKPELSKS